ncbi:MAG: triose-phosphate isomerase [Bdellovibrionales bacterium]|nr:triose-phosphate isomerase [Bdellovibrionales bacterium]
MTDSDSPVLVIGNWKMNLCPQAAFSLAERLAVESRSLRKSQLWLAPAFPSLAALTSINNLGAPQFQVGAQNVHWENSGAYTGESSPAMLQELGCTFAIVGHSERRHIFGESDKLVAKRALAAETSPLSIIFCVGETEEERKRGETSEILARQLGALFDQIPSPNRAKFVIAYEPVWAIGSGQVANPADISSAHQVIRDIWRERAKQECPPIAYGGSVSPENFSSIIELPLVAGALIGGASLDFEKLKEILSIAEN